MSTQAHISRHSEAEDEADAADELESKTLRRAVQILHEASA